MGYTTEFLGEISIEPPLNAEEVEFLFKFAGTRRMLCTQGPYFVDRSGSFGQGSEGVLDFNKPPKGQPGLWCQWVPSEDGKFLMWDGGEKFYDSVEWMEYLIDHFLRPDAKAKASLPLLQCNHICNGEILAQGEEINDRWKLIVRGNFVDVLSLE